jgi:hypothetical protein
VYEGRPFVPTYHVAVSESSGVHSVSLST